MIIKKQDGFTIVELMITMIIFLLAMTAASQMFVGLVTQFKQQSKIAETNIEGTVGLELLRFDIEQAGYGLPWGMNGLAYVEAADDQATWWNTPAADARIGYNDNPNPPRAFVVGAAAGLNGSDILVIKATNVATNSAAQKWTYSSNTGATNTLKTWGSGQEDLANTDHVTVLSPYSAGQQRVLVSAGGAYTRAAAANTSSTLTLADVAVDANYQPLVNSFDSTLIYGIAPATAANNFISMPFNRADYYIRRPATIPARCAPNTGVLYKGTLNHADGGHTELPLLDCVFDMQVSFALDTDANNTADLWGDIPVGYTVDLIRDRLKEVRVYIVAQEGQMDTSYTYTNPAPIAGCMGADMVCINDNVNFVPTLLKAVTVPNRNYRWKLYTLVTTPYNLK
ncbi:MAG: hypothetical protein C0402_01720 [Thermodesulfovibrio sp.]|nr:hypothetical protein [Thermodesulfovibrio sp.]